VYLFKQERVTDQLYSYRRTVFSVTVTSFQAYVMKSVFMTTGSFSALSLIVILLSSHTLQYILSWAVLN